MDLVHKKPSTGQTHDVHKPGDETSVEDRTEETSFRCTSIVVTPTGRSHINQTDVVDTLDASAEYAGQSPSVNKCGSTEDISRMKKHILKNLFVQAVGFLVMLTSLMGLGRLQSSLHQSEGLGTVCQAIQSMFMILSCMFLPKIMITLLGHKWTMCVSSLSILLWTGANGYAVWATMIPASILSGIFSAPLWTAQATYVTKLAIGWHKITGENRQVVTSRFFGFNLFTIALCK